MLQRHPPPGLETPQTGRHSQIKSKISKPSQTGCQHLHNFSMNVSKMKITERKTLASDFLETSFFEDQNPQANPDSAYFKHSRHDGGTGIMLHCNSRGYMVIAGLVPSGPAEKCGKIRINDILVSVNGAPVSILSYEKVVDMLIGPVDSVVTLCIRSPHSEEQQEVKLRRASLRNSRPKEQALVENLMRA